MTPEKRREICSKGGKALKAEQRTFSRNRLLAAEAGRKGGRQPKKKRLAQLAVDSVESQNPDVPRDTNVHA